MRNCVRVLLLVGSRARSESVDELADFDVSVFAEAHHPFTISNQWLSEIGKVWVCVPEKFDRKDEIIPTRLVIFDGGVKVDFAFFGLHVLEELVDSDELDAGFKVLLDKDGTTQKFKSPTFRNRKHARPSEGEFVNLINEFGLKLIMSQNT
jgi:aminoglycoside 6-adenylyltransferase